MVVFTCNHCGDSLQKPRVEKHYQTTCKRNSKSMTCVDCLKDFHLEEYAAHTKCITETERYAAKGTVVGVPKGAKKQESWVETVQNVVKEHKDNVSPNIKIIFDIIVKHSNIPKKKKPFTNYLMNSSGQKIKANDIEEVWNIMEKYKTDHNIQSTNLLKNKENDSKKSNKEENKLDTAEEIAQTNGEDKKKKKKSKKNKNNETDGETENQTINKNEENNIEERNKSKKKRKSKDESVEVEDVPEKKQKLEEGETPQENGEKKSKKKKKKSKKMEENNTESEESKTKKAETEEQSAKNKIIMDEFNWSFVIHEILEKNSDGIHKDKLMKKVFKKFEKETGTIVNENEKKIIKHYNHKLQSLQNITTENDLVKFSQFPWKYTIEKILRNEPNGIQTEELKEKVSKECEKFNGAVIEKFDKLFIKRLESIRNKTIYNNIIRLLQ